MNIDIETETATMDTKTTLYLLMDIVDTFLENSDIIEFRCMLHCHLDWLNRVRNDQELYDPIYKYKLNELKEFLKNAECYFEEFIDLYRDYENARRAFEWYEHYDPYQPMSEFFVELVSELEYILDRTPSRDYDWLHEKNREFYCELNKYILKPERIEKMSHEYGMDEITYMDAIGV